MNQIDLYISSYINSLLLFLILFARSNHLNYQLFATGLRVFAQIQAGCCVA